MTLTTTLEKAEIFVRHLLAEGLTPDHRYHNLAHTLAVRDACIQLATKTSLSAEESEDLQLAALFHDTGLVETYREHEVASRRIAKAFLEEHQHPAVRLEQVLNCIDATFLSRQPVSLMEQLIRDADLAHLGAENYKERLNGLRHEWKIFLNQEYSEQEWYRLNFDFLQHHIFYTPAAWALYGPKREENLQSLKKKVKKVQKEAESGGDINLEENRSSLMMFKAALRNHLDLSALADNKANIMLSVNALIITIVVPLAATRLRDLPYLLVPVLVLLATCLTSMIFATLATRPIKMGGYTSPEMIQGKRSNLFFFGNFYKMGFQEYKNGIGIVLKSSALLEDSIVRDLFFLGKSLGVKFRYLRICYNLFMWGVSAAVLLSLIMLGLNAQEIL